MVSIDNSGHLQFNYLPYIALKDDLKVGNILFWPFYKKKDEYIESDEIRAQLEKFLKQNIDKELQPLKNITMASYGNPNNFTRLSFDQLKELRDAAQIICFSTLVYNDLNSLSPGSSDEFQLVHQNFKIGDDGIAPSAGSLIRSRIGGYKIEEVFFCAPHHVVGGYFANFNDKVLRGLENLQADKKREEAYRRVLSAIEWFNRSYTNVENFNYGSRIIMLTTAFEFLLKKLDGKKKFAKKIKRYTCTDLDEKDEWRLKVVVCDDGRKEVRNWSVKEWWAYEFYDLRNKIMHGDLINELDFLNRKNENYYLLGVKFFEECLKKILAEYGHYTYDWGDELLWERIREKI